MVLGVLLAVGLAMGCGGGRPATPLPEGDSEIAFTSRDSDWGYIYVLSSNGSKRRLVRIKATVDAVAWRRDGAALAWIDSPDLGRGYLPGVSDISVINADGSGMRTVITSAGVVSPLSWSPDSRRLMFGCGTADRHDAVCVVNVDGSGRHLLPAAEAVELEGGTWSPTGKSIAFEGAEQRPPYRISIYTRDVHGAALRRVTDGHPSPGGDFSPSFSQDGRRIVFVRAVVTKDSPRTYSTNGHLYIVNADATGLRELKLPIDGALDAPQWSPYGKHITFSRLWGPDCGVHCHSDIYVVNADGTHLRELTHEGDASNPAWSRASHQ